MSEAVLDLGLLGKAVLNAGEEEIRVRGKVPFDLELFKDHFPGFPVFPGVLVLDIFKKAAEAVMAPGGALTRPFRLRSIQRVRFSSFLAPDMAWECTLRRADEAEGLRWKAIMYHETARVASAELIFGPGE